MPETPAPPPLPLWKAFLLFLAAALLFALGASAGLSWLTRHGVPQPVAFFLPAALLFALFLAAALRFAAPPGAPLRERLRLLRLRRMDRGDWAWAAGAIVGIGAASALLSLALGRLGESTGLFTLERVPGVLGYRAFGAGDLWILPVHAVYLFLNLFGEGLLWQGLVLPRQEAVHGRAAFAVNGTLWTLVHAFTGPAALAMTPLLFGVPYVTQRRRNTTVGIVVHAVFAGGGFYAVALGLA